MTNGTELSNNLFSIREKEKETLEIVTLASEEQCKVNAVINKRELAVLIDSGADFNYISETIYMQLNNATMNKPMTPKEGINEVVVGNKQTVQIVGWVRFHVILGEAVYNI